MADYEIVEPRETPETRLKRLKQFLADELISNTPSPMYIQDLQDSIVQMQGNKQAFN